MQAVGTVGFPIVCCGALGWAFYKMNIQHAAQIKELTESHRSEMNELKQALENNTLAVQKLCVMVSEKETEQSIGIRKVGHQYAKLDTELFVGSYTV